MRSAQRSNSQHTLSGQTDNMFWPLFLSNLLLSALSIANLGLVSSMVGFLHDQKDNVHSYEVAWPEGTVKLNVEPAHLWTDQGHASNGVAGYGFFLGLFGMYVAWRQRRQTNTKRISKSLTALLVLLFLAVLFTLSALIFVFVVTQRTRNQAISQAVADVNQGINYPALEWTPETWFKAVLDTPLADRAQHDEIAAKVLNMTVWRWMLLPILVVDVAAWIVAALAVSKQRNGRGVDADMAEQSIGLMPGRSVDSR
jgi:4-amino-4-deoxy-L-arabinose transferase-like glycosyltransferase